MPRVSKKNISGVLEDVKHPSTVSRKKTTKSVPVSGSASYRPALAKKSRPPRQKPWWQKKRLLVYGVIAIVVIVFAVNLTTLKNSVLASARNAQNYFLSARDSLFSLDTKDAKTSFEGAQNELENIQNNADKYGVFKLTSLFGEIFPAIKNAAGLFSSVKKASEISVALINDIDVLARDGIGYAFSGRGNLLIQRLESIQPNISALQTTAQTARNQLTALEKTGGKFGGGDSLGSNYLSIDIELSRISDFIAGTLSLLKSNQDTHILVLFQNPSEMRPSGGFLGSYADVVLNGGNVTALDVRDVYDADGQLDAKIIPPEPLQVITKKWGARDANWFFDFPTSAQKIMSFLEMSRFYKERSTTFSGVVAINANVVQNILALTGPIELPEYKVTIDEHNFLSEIQKEVESSRARETGQPKQILKSITPIITQRMLNLNDEQKQVLLGTLQSDIEQKDVQMYFRDQRIENFLIARGIGGEVMSLPRNFAGDYLAVVNANIGGGKTDIFMKQSISLISTITADGSTKDSLSVTKTHTGEKESFSLYRLPNQSFTQVFTVASSTLTSLAGNTTKNIYPPTNYASGGYVSDPDTQKIASSTVYNAEFKAYSMEQSGKSIFGSWFIVPPGATKTLEVDYERTGIAVGNGKPYQFIFEKQSGVPTKFDLTIEAPPGYRWREAGGSIFSYHTDTPESRIILNLTFVKI